MNAGTKKKKQIQFRYYEIPQGEPCLALLGEAWVRRYGDGVGISDARRTVDSLYEFCADVQGIIVIF